MFTRLLVPLDGSTLAESALPAAAYVASKLSIPVTLLHMIEINPPKEVHGERHLTDSQEALAYLDEIANRAFPPEIQVQRHVHTVQISDVAASIVEHVEELGTDLIVMCTHGRSGLRNWLFGSIAQQVIGLGKTPVLLIQPQADGSAPDFTCQRLLVPLDGNPDHEQSLLLASEIAQICASTLHLVMVVPTLGTLSGEKAATAQMLPGATTAMLDMKQQEGEFYLQRHEARISALGIKVDSEVVRGDPVSVIVRVRHQVKADLIILGTHGKTGMDAFWSGSVTPKIASRSQIPMLLVPVQSPEK